MMVVLIGWLLNGDGDVVRRVRPPGQPQDFL